MSQVLADVDRQSEIWTEIACNHYKSHCKRIFGEFYKPCGEAKITSAVKNEKSTNDSINANNYVVNSVT